MKKLAVFFPGIGYTVDKPLLHYSRKLVADTGYEVKLLPYSGFPQKVKGDRDKMLESYRIALAQSEEMLSDIDFSDYNSVLFVGKSIGTIVAAEIAAKNLTPVQSHFILYTPLEDTFKFPIGDAIVFTGSADPWVKNGAISDLCAERGIPCHVIQSGNHSLETGNVQDDIEHLRKIMKKAEKYIRQIGQ